MKQDASPSSHQQANEPQYYLPPGVSERADELTQDSQAANTDGRVAPDSIKEGWLNCKISNIDGKVCRSIIFH